METDIIKPVNPNTYKIDGCFLDEEKRFCFIHIYKNASISLRNVLGMRGRYYKYSDVTGLDLITICIIRHPILRAVSSYLYLLRLESNDRTNQHPVELTSKTKFFKEREDVILSFNYFLDAIDGGNFFDAVTYPQCSFIRDRGIDINSIEEVFIQEHLTEEFEHFKNKYKLPADLSFPKDNKSPEKKSQLIKDYIGENKDVQKRIADIYREDVNIYNRLVTDRYGPKEAIKV